MKPHLLALFTLLPCLALAQTPTTSDQTPPGPPPGEGQWHHHGPLTADELLQHLTKALDLTSSQQEEIKPILDTEVTKLNALHSDTSLSEEDKHAQMKSIHEDAKKQILPVLNADQAKKFSQMHPHHGPPPNEPPPAQ
jgi:Spy/CpxP family protein refolding chaperone